MNLYLKFCKKISSWMLTVSACGLLLMTCIITWQIFDRYILDDTPNWSEKLSLFIMNWYVFLAVAVGVHEKFHLGLVFLSNMAKGIFKKIIEVIIYLTLGTFAIYMVVYGIMLIEKTASHTIPALGISTGWSYLPLPVSGILILIFSLEHIIATYNLKEK